MSCDRATVRAVDGAVISGRADVIYDNQDGQKIGRLADFDAIKRSEAQIAATIDSLRRRDFEPRPGRRKCRECDVRRMCSAAPTR